jgi:methionine-R-sulfoxide reductase
MRHGGTEPPFTNKYWRHFENGEYRCVGCNSLLFTSAAKFSSDCGWPAFSKPADDAAVFYREDASHGMRRTEVLCANCKGHLGHIFEDGPEPLGTRYCINSVCLNFQEEKGKLNIK